MKKISFPEEAVTTVLWSGYFPIAPATVASAVTCVIIWFIPALLNVWGMIATIPATLIGVWLSNRYIAGYEVEQNHKFAKLRRPNPKKSDPDPVVFDEFVGQWITLFAVPHTIFAYLAAFFVFRLFDIFKPFGIGKTQQLPGGWGVMIDDVLAGIAGAILLYVVLLFLPGVLG
ncbi:phosphatidylglycerophosphatase A [bacterium]|nr:phosphatidylglycerophosphatase A [bacterium]